MAATVAAGVALGLVAAYALSPYIESLLYQVPAVDPTLFGVAAAAVVLAAAGAAVGPIRRMLSVEPAEALRAE